MTGNRKKTSIKSSENCETSADLPGQNFQCLIEENQQRRQSVNNISDEEEDNTEHEAETAKGSVDLPSDVGPSALTGSTTFEYADLDFSNFDKEKDESCFKVGQVWDAYDTLDARTRFLMTT
ncbi:hypothetical protein H5410_004502 [Solanum commersonii]|uniref:DUF3444 domain-containing protein n=1 Tax=Solanum commersonii TaxID=4109 RepID=A0A9J6B7Z1_SOLCO|nr:hypothetical protein H5410_004502 [Solanum commersonii]